MAAADGYLSSDIVVARGDLISHFDVCGFCSPVLSTVSLSTHCSYCCRPLGEANDLPYDGGCCEIELFCSPSCRDAKRGDTHWVLCDGRKKSGFAADLRRFITYCRTSGDIFYISAIVAAQAVTNISLRIGDSLQSPSGDELQAAFAEEFRSRGFDVRGGLCDNSGGGGEEEGVEEGFILLQTSILNRLRASDDSSEVALKVSLMSRCLTLRSFAGVIAMLRQRLVQVAMVDRLPAAEKLAQLEILGGVGLGSGDGARVMARAMEELLAACPELRPSSSTAAAPTACGDIPPAFLVRESTGGAAPQLENRIRSVRAACSLPRNRHLFQSPVYALPIFSRRVKEEESALEVVGSSCISNASLRYDAALG